MENGWARGPEEAHLAVMLHGGGDAASVHHGEAVVGINRGLLMRILPISEG